MRRPPRFTPSRRERDNLASSTRQLSTVHLQKKVTPLSPQLFHSSARDRFNSAIKLPVCPLFAVHNHLTTATHPYTLPPTAAMAAPPGMSPQQMAAFQQHMQQQLAAEASKRGMTPEEFIKMQREQVNAEAAKHGMTPEQYVNNMRMRALQQRAAAQQQAQAQAQAQAQGGQQADGQPQQQAGQQQQGQPQGQPQQPQQQQVQQQVPVNPNNPPDPKAIAVAQWLRSQNLKSRTCILDGQRKDMFKGITPLPLLNKSLKELALT